MQDRRRFLTGIATVTTIAIAGCSSEPVPGDGPEAAVEQYFTAVENDDEEAANEVLHPESNQYPVEEGEFETDEEISLNDANQISTKEYVEWQTEQSGGSGGVTDEEIQEGVETIEQEVEKELDEIEADDYALVLVSFDRGSGEKEELTVLTVKDDGSWYWYGQ